MFIDPAKQRGLLIKNGSSSLHRQPNHGCNATSDRSESIFSDTRHESDSVSEGSEEIFSDIKSGSDGISDRLDSISGGSEEVFSDVKRRSWTCRNGVGMTEVGNGNTPVEKQEAPNTGGQDGIPAYVYDRRGSKVRVSKVLFILFYPPNICTLHEYKACKLL